MAITLISLIGVFYLWNDLFATRAVLAGYTKPQILTYYVLIGYIFSSIYASLPISSDIITGNLSTYLTKPVKYLWIQYWQTVARRVLRLLLGLPVIIIIFVVFKNQLFVVTDVAAYFYLVFTAFFAINILFLLDVLINSIEFWVMHSDTISSVTDPIFGFFAGTIIPLAFLPSWAAAMSDVLPFKYTGAFIIDAFLGRLELTQIIQGCAVQLLWTVLLLAVVRFVWQRGLKKYEAIGG